MINVERNENYLKSYDEISEDLKYITKSLVRMKILATLYRRPLNMKDLNSETGLSYSSISSNMHSMELRGYVYRQSNKYFLTNSIRFQIENLLEFKEVVNLLNDFFNILDQHLIDMIPNQSVAELYLLGQATLLESDDVDVYRMYHYIENSIAAAGEVRCILPFYHEGINKKLNGLVRNRKDVEAVIPQNLLSTFIDSSRIKKISTFKGTIDFLLICTDDVMILGLFREDGFFDQNRLVTSKNPDSLKWASNLFENFKKLSK